MILPIAMAISESLSPEEDSDDVDVPLGIPYHEQVRRLSVAVDKLRKKSVGCISQRSIKIADAFHTPPDVIPEEKAAFLSGDDDEIRDEHIEAGKCVAGKQSAAWQSGISKALQLSTAYGANIGGMATLIGAYPNMVMKINVEK